MGRRASVLVLPVVLVFSVSRSPAATSSAADTLSFELPGPAGAPIGWHVGPAGTVFLDSTNAHGGRFAVRLTRDASSPRDFSVLTRTIPVTFTGDTLELRGWLETEGVEKEVRPPRGDYQLPVVLRPVEGKFVVGAFPDSVLGPASGLAIGDVIRKLDGRSVDSLAAACAPYYGASNEAARSRDIARSLTRGAFGPCRVQAERAGKTLELTVARDSNPNQQGGKTHDLPGATFRLLAPDVAYLKFSSVVQDDAASYVKKAAGTRCFVLDIRNYPSQFVPFALGQHLVEKVTPFARFTRSDAANPGAFRWTPSVEIQPQAPHYGGKVVILVDEVSQSSAEYTAMAMRAAPGALVVGSMTAGADGNVSAIPLPGGLRAVISGIGVFYPDKSPTQRRGIEPNLVVRPTIEGIRAGRDEVLEAALEKVLGRKVPVVTR